MRDDSPGLRIYDGIRITLALIGCTLSSGIVFGFPALKPVLIDYGAYSNLCSKVELGPHHSCTAQELRLDQLFVFSIGANHVAVLPVIIFLDRYGPKLCGILGSILLAVGAHLIARVDEIGRVDSYLWGFLMLAVAGQFVLFSALHLSNLFPRQSSAILALFSGAYYASSGVFAAYNLINYTTTTIAPRTWFTFYQAVPCFIALFHIVLVPADSYQTVSDVTCAVVAGVPQVPQRLYASVRQFTIQDQFESLLSDHERQTGQIEGQCADVVIDDEGYTPRKITDPTRNCGVWGALHRMPLTLQLQSRWFNLIAALSAVLALRVNHLIATVHSQYQVILTATNEVSPEASHNQVDLISMILAYALPLSCLITPVICLLLDHFSASTVLTLTVLMSIVSLLTNVVQTFSTGVVTVVISAFLRPLYHEVISDTISKVFGFNTYGMVYGLVFAISGISSQLIVALNWISHRYALCGTEAVNVAILLSTIIIGTITTRYLWDQARRGYPSLAIRDSMFVRSYGAITV
uniref:ARAD1D40678p n=1 Tax=Blastobotrys adeninivorans TaxID=409370 RepID=A0A060TIT1_BLAAD